MADYTTRVMPSSRVATFDVGWIGGRKHMVSALLEVDVTAAREQVRRAVREGLDVGFMAWLVGEIGSAIGEDPAVQAMRRGRRSLVVFDGVDIAVTVERRVDGVRVPLVTVIRDVQAKDAAAVQGELRAAKAMPVDSARDYVLESGAGVGGRWATGIFFGLPQAVRLLFWRVLLRDPVRRKRQMGTAMVTSIGMAGGTPGWVLAQSLHNLCFGIGTISRKPWVVGGSVVSREILHLTVMFDHDVIDGMPAARFCERLVKRLEGANLFLNDHTVI